MATIRDLTWTPNPLSPDPAITTATCSARAGFGSAGLRIRYDLAGARFSPAVDILPPAEAAGSSPSPNQVSRDARSVVDLLTVAPNTEVDVKRLLTVDPDDGKGLVSLTVTVTDLPDGVCTSGGCQLIRTNAVKLG